MTGGHSQDMPDLWKFYSLTQELLTRYTYSGDIRSLFVRLPQPKWKIINK